MEKAGKTVKEAYSKGNIDEIASSKYSKNINEVHSETLTPGEKVADKIAVFAGSWKFIISFIVILILWIIFNSLYLVFRPFDPYPFILLNLILSCLAALQAPVIMMSQNRQEAKDRLRSEHDYEVNLKAEILIEKMLSKLDDLEENQRKLDEHIMKLGISEEEKA